MSFKVADSLDPHGGPILREGIAANSIVLTELDAVVWDTDGFVALGTAGAALFGHCVGIVARDGTPVTSNGSGANFSGTFTMTSDNETDVADQVRARVDLSMLTIYDADVDATLGTTTSSDEIGAYFDLIDEDDLNESSAADTAAQYHSWGVTPTDSGNVLVNIFESSIFTAV